MSEGSKPLVKLTVNGIPVEVPEGTTILPAAQKAGVHVPHFCYHPDLSLAGNCRICQVDIEGSPKLVVSCMTPVKEGMVVRTDSERAKKAVQGDLEFLLLNHPVDCPICDQAGECSLQDFYMQVGLHASRIPLTNKLRKRKVVRLGSSIVLDTERCVMCSRCIRFSDEVSRTNQLGFCYRGSKMEIGTFRDRPLEDAYAGCYADVCPVGALTSADFRFNQRVWFLENTESVCAECSTGCNVRIDHRGSRIHRYVPRRNEDVNRSWMCDEGRQSYKKVMSVERLDKALVRQEAASLNEALDRVVHELRSARDEGKVVAGLATARASNEELYLFRSLISGVMGSPHLDFRVDPATGLVDELEDDVLRRRDPNPNTRGATLVGLVPGRSGHDVAGILAAAAAGDIDVLYLLGPELLTRWPDQEATRRALEGVRFAVMHDTEQREEHGLVDVVLPVAAFAEADGTFVNYGMRVQRFLRAVAPPGQARPAAEILAEILTRLGGQVVPGSAREVFELMSSTTPAFGGLSFTRVGPKGVRLEPVEAAPVV